MKKIIILTICIYHSICSLANAQENKMTVALHWQPQAEFAGFYVAKYNGIYKKYGLDIDFKYCNGGIKSASELSTGKADFATFSLIEGLLKINKGDKIVELAQLFQKSSQMLISKNESGIVTPGDLNGKKVALWRAVNNSVPKAFFKNLKVTPIIVPVNDGIDLFIEGAVDSLLVMKYNEYHSIINSGINKEELTRFELNEYEMDLPYTGIFTQSKTYNSNRIMCRNFIDATVKGWQYSFDHPDEAMKIIMKEMAKHHVATNKSHQKWMFSEIEKLFNIEPDKKLDIKLSDETLYKTIKILTDDNLLNNERINYSKFNKTGTIYAEQ